MNAFEEGPAQVQGFVVRVLDRGGRYPGSEPLFQEKSAEDCLSAVRFEGYPALARAGYKLAGGGAAAIGDDISNRFMQCIEQQRGRPGLLQSELAGDALSLLGIADGIRAVANRGDPNAGPLASACAWMRELLNQHGWIGRAAGAGLGYLPANCWTNRGDSGDGLIESDDGRVAALDLCLWASWKDVLGHVEHPDTEQRRELFKMLLTAPPPDEGELLHAASWLCAFDVLTSEGRCSLQFRTPTRSPGFSPSPKVVFGAGGGRGRPRGRGRCRLGG